VAPDVQQVTRLNAADVEADRRMGSRELDSSGDESLFVFHTADGTTLSGRREREVELASLRSHRGLGFEPSGPFADSIEDPYSVFMTRELET
jgi:hypothetical protein